MNKISLRINNEEFTSFKTATLRRSIEYNSGEATIVSSVNETQGLPAKAGDFVQILIEDTPKLTGYVDEISGIMDDKRHLITFSVRDTIQDLIDSSVPEEVRNIPTPISFVSFVTKVIESLGLDIRVINEVIGITDFTETEKIISKAGTTAMDFINSYARKKQVYLIPDGSGNIIIFRPDEETTQSQILNQVGNQNNNVKSHSFSIRQQERYNKYICRSQSDLASNPFAADYTTEGTNINSEAIDDQIRASRILEIISDESMTKDECQKRADEESNLRRSMATEYNCVVQGFISNTSEIWDIGQTIKVNDDYASMIGIFLIKSVEYNQDNDLGSTTNISCCTPDAFQVIAGLNIKDSRRSNQGSEFQLFEPDNTERYNR